MHGNCDRGHLVRSKLLRRLEACGCVCRDRRSRPGRARPRYGLRALAAGDVLVVWKLDRLARSLRDLLQLLEGLERLGASFRSLTEPIDTSSALGEFVLQILGAVAQFERALIRERAIAGQVAAYRRGVRWGGQPKVLSDSDAAELVRLHAMGLFSIPLLADIFSVSPSTVYRRVWDAQGRTDIACFRKRGLPVLRHYL
ncbi:MAG: recombinase family protein [Proteobacteria bacterium]|nr:recombinase family protein [Pseudomonadota bacterium]